MGCNVLEVVSAISITNRDLSALCPRCANPWKTFRPLCAQLQPSAQSGVSSLGIVNMIYNFKPFVNMVINEIRYISTQFVGIEWREVATAKNWQKMTLDNQ